nr:hypothetical protein Iba_chr01bCG6290 [Ipomoea batatas]
MGCRSSRSLGGLMWGNLRCLTLWLGAKSLLLLPRNPARHNASTISGSTVAGILLICLDMGMHQHHKNLGQTGTSLRKIIF